MTHVCLVMSTHPSAAMGGAQYQTHLLATELALRPGVEVTYLARYVDERTTEGLSYAVKRIGSGHGIRRRAVFFDAFDLWRTLRELQPDVIYQRMKQSYTAACALYARRADVPLFFQIASEADLDRRWGRRRFSANLPFELIELTTGNWGLRRATHVVAQTERQGAILRARFGREPIEVVLNSQPLPAALPDKPAGATQVLWVGNFKDVKRPELFVDLAESFAGRRDLEFLMVGREARLRRYTPLMQRIETVSNLKYLGPLPIEEVNSLMSRCAVHVNTSAYEGFPNTFIQAWGRGAVVASIAVDVDGGMESRGIGYCTGSLEGLRFRIDELAQQPRLRQEIARRAFAYAREHHSLRNAARLADLLLDSAAAAPAALQRGSLAP